VTGTIAHYRHKSATSDGTFADGENCRFARRPDEAPKRTAPLNSIVGATAASLGDIRDYREHPDHHEQHRPQASTGRFRGHDGTGVSEQDVLAAYLTAFAKVGLDRYDFPVSPLLIDCQTNQWPRTTQCRERRHPPFHWTVQGLAKRYGCSIPISGLRLKRHVGRSDVGPRSSITGMVRDRPSAARRHGPASD
jgi:hypothetical protein